MLEQGKKEGFFFVKKKQKTFIRWGTGAVTCTVPIHESFFASFFTKKEVLFPSLFWKRPRCPC
jgi:TRAP-type uncharacterized transport system substrate-binding protein